MQAEAPRDWIIKLRVCSVTRLAAAHFDGWVSISERELPANWKGLSRLRREHAQRSDGRDDQSEGRIAIIGLGIVELDDSKEDGNESQNKR
jgi:hypothetical protein